MYQLTVNGCHTANMKAFCAENKTDRLSDRIPGRSHSAFPYLKANIMIDDPDKVKQRLVQYSRKLDMSKAMFH